ncbi:MAG: hypothetical protein ACR2GY_13875 [Phycisphaerales bacterium]
MESNLPHVSGEFAHALSTLLEHNVDFVLCGGVACVLHGVARVTADLDICVAMSRDNLMRLLEALGDLHFHPRIPEPAEALLSSARRQEWIDSKGAMVFTFVHGKSPLQIDVFLHYPIAYTELRSAAQRLRLQGADLLISSKRDLIRAKQHVQPMRTVDERDIHDLKELIAREQ